MVNTLQLVWTKHSKPLAKAVAEVEWWFGVADFQPNKAPPLSSVEVAAGGDIFTAEGPKPHSTPQALDKAGISKVGISILVPVRQLMLDWCPRL